MIEAASGQPQLRGSRLARNALINFCALVIPLIVALLTVPYMIRGFGTERFGVFSVVWLLLTLLAELGFGSTTTRFAAEAIGAGRSNEVGAIAWTTAAMQFVIGIIVAAALALSTPLLVERVLQIPDALAWEARASLFLLAASLPVLGCARSFRGVLEATQRFDLVFAVHLPITIATYALAALGATLGWTLPLVIGIIVAARVIALPVNYFAARVALPGSSLRPRLELDRLRAIASFAGWVALSTLVAPLLVYLDRFMVGALLSMTAVAFYAAPYEIVGRLTLIPGAVVGALFPAFSQLSGSATRSQAEQLAARSANMLIVLLAPIVIAILGAARDGLALWLGAEYALRSGTALQILAVGFLINALAHVPYNLLHSTGRADLPARFHLIELPLHIFLAWLLITRLGITGAALAWTSRILLDAVLLFGATQRTKQLGAATLVAHSVPVTAAVAALFGILALAGAWVLPSVASRLLAVTAITVASATTLWFVGVTAAERRRITALLRPAA